MDADAGSGLRHQRIIANAGSGKTHRLTTRYIELLERGVPAEHIVALTFTRKAAGEFMDAIFNRLLKASASGREAHALAHETKMPGLTSQRCLEHLRQLVEKLPLLTLGTLDSFFGRILRAFPFECGLASEVTIIDDHLQGILRRQVLAEVFREQLRDSKGFADFLDLIRQQSRNREGRDVSGTLDHEIESLHERFLLTPADKPWGKPSTIWPSGSPLLVSGDLLDLTKMFERELFRVHPGMEDKHRRAWEARLREIRALKTGSPASDSLITFAVRALDPPADRAWPGHFKLTHSKTTFRFPNNLRDSVVMLGKAILRVDLEGRLTRSQALHRLLARFEARYQVQVRDNGQLTFLDVAGLLAAGSASWGSRTLRPFSRQEMNFRLDASYDHWLLDEFQDTSRLQWQALRDLVDEVIQSDSGRRSFFYVGDTKQAIYAWRGGDPRLFDEVSDFYNASGTQRIDTSEALDVSFRSAPEILGAVNTIFSPEHLQRLASIFEFPMEVLDRWRSAWRHHEPYDPLAGRGYFEWRSMETPSDERKVLLDEETARLIGEVDPLAKGWSCAVLVRTNPRILTVIDALRRAGLPASSEGRIFPYQDSDLAGAILALVRFIAHPKDTLSHKHLMMTPLAKFVEGDLDEFRGSALARIRETGFHGFLAHWSGKLNIEDKPFAKQRTEELLIAASKFDAAWRGRAGLDEFVSFARSYESSENPAGKTIRVLTMHAAKGLDFDMVVLPDIDTESFSPRRDGSVHLHLGPDGQVQWGLELPPAKVCATDPVLSQAWEKDAAEECYESLCLSYVAVTRAKRGLYILSRKLGPKSDRKDFNRLLHETFGRNGIASGNPTWHKEIATRPAALREDDISLVAGHLQPGPAPLLPSEAGGSLINAAALFGETSARAAGSEVHQALAKISWLDEGLPDLTNLPPGAAVLISDFLKTNAAARLFARPAGRCSLWREKAFDVTLDGQWISGVFDRVVIYRGESGQAQRAAIYDFKTDERDIAKTYSMQMNLYRKSLSLLIGLREDKITSTLIAVRTGEEIPVRPPGELVQMNLL
jgi:ATP-dependent exoDNAse (exonuclease V) beta subunit